MSSTISIIINYCSNESMFIVPLLKQCSYLENANTQVIVSIGTHMYDMTPEDTNMIQDLQEQFPNVIFVWYTVDQPCPPFPRNPLKQRPHAFWHNIARIAGWKQATNDWILFLDADEILDGKEFQEWMRDILPTLPIDYAYKLANYWYFREPIYQATTFEDSAVLIHRSRIATPYDAHALMTDHERDGIIAATETKTIHHVCSSSKLPMIHHFSWVRTKESMIKKVNLWGHKNDMDWVFLIEREFSGNFTGTDFVHGYKYIKVSNKFDIQHKK